MRLGDLIDTLEAHDPDMPIRFSTGHDVGPFFSWRGRYDELTLVPDDDRPGPGATVGHVLANARDADGETFTGYKGGEYTMNRGTPVWADDYGDCAYNAIIGARVENGVLVLVRQRIEEYIY